MTKETCPEKVYILSGSDYSFFYKKPIVDSHDPSLFFDHKDAVRVFIKHLDAGMERIKEAKERCQKIFQD